MAALSARSRRGRAAVDLSAGAIATLPLQADECGGLPGRFQLRGRSIAGKLFERSKKFLYHAPPLG
jgi:hypothetical protein